MNPALEYARDVRNGRIIVCRWVRLVVDRFYDDLSHGRARGVKFSPLAARAAVDFIHAFCRHVKGKWANRYDEYHRERDTRIRLEPWQQFITWQIFGWKQRDTGYRRFRTAYIEVARKNAKTTWAAGIGLYLTIADNEEGAEVYTTATTRDQAKICHGVAVQMRDRDPVLEENSEYFRGSLTLVVDKTASKFAPLSADHNTLDGLNIHGGICDELHEWPKRELWDVIETATGARTQSLQLAITTAGHDQNGICFEQREYVTGILKGTIQDDSYFGIIFTLDRKSDWPDLDEDDDWTDDRCWGKANPNLGVSIDMDRLQKLRDKAMQIPAAQNNFLRKHMNIWTQQATRWIDLELWDSNFSREIYATG